MAIIRAADTAPAARMADEADEADGEAEATAEAGCSTGGS